MSSIPQITKVEIIIQQTEAAYGCRATGQYPWARARTAA